MKIFKFQLLPLFIVLVSCSPKGKTQKITFSNHDLVSTSLAESWDEGLPLGNGFIGALVWEKEGNLRMSLDNVNLWDLRPMKNLNTPNYKFSWVYEQWKNDTYNEVQKNFDVPYDKSPAPSKIPGAGMEFDIASFGKVISNKLSVANAIAEVKWENGVVFNSFVQATEQVGWFSFKGVETGFKPMLIPPAYNTKGKNKRYNQPLEEGDVIQLIHMDDPWSPILPLTRGIVVGFEKVPSGEPKILVKWILPLNRLTWQVLGAIFLRNLQKHQMLQDL